MDGKGRELGSRESYDGWLYELLMIICILYGRWLVTNGTVWVVVLLSQWSDGVNGIHSEQLYLWVSEVCSA